MSYISVNIDVDIDDIIDAMNSSDKRSILKELSDKDIIEEFKRRKLKLDKLVSINQFTLLDSYKKREHLIKLLDLPSYANNEEIIKSVKENI